MRLPTARSRAATVLALAVAGSVVLTAAPASAAPNTERLGTKLAREVTVDGVNRHLIAFQRIADQNEGTRASGLPGFDASATYVHDKLAAAGWNVTYQEFDVPVLPGARAGRARTDLAGPARRSPRARCSRTRSPAPAR